MKIRELNIVEFGCLKNVRISLCDGVNIIGGDNESGKSTVMLFIRFMFYGLPKRSQKSYDRERSLSFDGHRAAGSLVLEHGGREYRIERVAVGTSKISETLRIFDVLSAEELSGEPWERFLGVTADVFESSCAINQSRAASIDRAGAAHALENMLASADESIDVSAVLDSIDKVRREYKLNRGDGGILFDLDSRIAALEERRRGAEERQLNVARLELRTEKMRGELDEALRLYSEAEADLEASKKAQILSRFDAQKKNIASKDALSADLSAERESFKYPDVSPTEETAHAIDAAARDVRVALQKRRVREAEYENLEKSTKDAFPLAEIGTRIATEGGAAVIYSTASSLAAKAKTSRICAVLTLVLAIVLAPLGMILGSLPMLLLLLGLSAASVATAIILFVSASRSSARSRRICESYGKELSTLKDYLELCAAQLASSLEAQKEREAALTRLEDARQDVALSGEALAALLPHTEGTHEELVLAAAEISSAIRAVCERRRQISIDIAALEALINDAARSLAEYDENALREELAKCERILPLDSAELAVKFASGKKDILIKNLGMSRELLAAERGGIVENPVELGDRIKALRVQRNAKQRYFDALMLAKETIEEASSSMSGNVTPEISRKAGEIMELVSQGKHPALHASRSLELSVDEDGFGYSVNLLSEGARDCAYIALRISLMLRIFGSELPPLILDDALCQLDDTRAEAFLSLLDRLSSLPMQSIIFTCHAREKQICEKHSIEHSHTSLSH